jgi:hypothetical protein
MIYRSLVKQLFWVVIILLAHSNCVKAQNQDDQPPYYVKTGFQAISNVQGTGEALPFWMHVNRDGRVYQNSANALNYIEGYSKLFDTKKVDIESGVSLSSRYSDVPVLFFDKAYLKIRAFDFKLMGGRYIDYLSEKENELSTGSFMYSRNATPIPKIAIATDGFVDVPSTKGIIRYNGLFAHGWFEDDRYVSDAYLHEKYFYLSVKYDFFDAVGGIVHNVQWGGVSQGNRGKLPSGWDAYKEVVFASGSSDPNAPEGEQGNVVGNSVAAYDFSLGLYFDKFDLRAYRIFYLEDKVSTRFRSPWDGVWGLSIKPKGIPLVQNILWEHINTKKQDSFDYEPYGTSRYYNNFVYRTGWTYHRRVIGNPLLLTDKSDGSSNYPVYNNIIIGHHFGLSGTIMPGINYSFKYTFTRNYGNFTDQIIRRLDPAECNAIPYTTCAELRPLGDLKKINNSVVLDLNYLPANNRRIKYGLSIASDFGELYDNRLGMMLKLEYNLISSEK